MKNVLILCLLSLMFSCKKKIVENSSLENSQKELVPSVTVKKMKRIRTPIPIEASGVLGVSEILNLSFKVGGVIEEIKVKETQKVKKGQLLASIRATEIDAQVMKSQQVVEKAKRDLIRMEQLYADSAATLEQVENMTTLRDLSISDLNVVRLNQDYAKITAPVSGHILKRFSENNEYIAPGVPVLQMATLGKKGFVLRIHVADKDVVRIRLNDKAKVYFDAYPRQKFRASVSKIAEVADPKTGAFEIELAMTSFKGLILKSGFVGEVVLFPSRQPSYYKIEMSALVEGFEKSANVFALREEEGKKFVEKIKVYPDHIGVDFFMVSKNQLTEDMQLVIKGASYLVDGMEVRIVE